MSTFYNRTKVHPAVHMHAAEVAAGDLSRREFLSRATALGVTATAAYAMIGAKPAAAAAHAHRMGWVDARVRVIQPGGLLIIDVAGDGEQTQLGGAQSVREASPRDQHQRHRRIHLERHHQQRLELGPGLAAGHRLQRFLARCLEPLGGDQPPAGLLAGGGASQNSPPLRASKRMLFEP